MVNISKSGNAIKFEFTDSDHYLYGDGVVEVPVNSLSLVVDESKFVVFKKAASNDTFITFDPANSNLSDKAGVIEFYKTNMVGSSGGGSDVTVDPTLDSGSTNPVANSAITTALNAKADTSAVTAVATDVSTLSGQVATKLAISDFNAYSAATDARLAEDEEVTAAALINLDETKQDALEYYSEDTENKSAEILITNDDGEGSTVDNHFNIGGGVAEIGIYNEYDDGQGNVTSNNSFIYADQTMINLQAGVTENGDTTSTELSVETTGVTINGDVVATEPYVDAAISGKVDTSAITTAITSGSTDSEIPTAKAVYDATQGGGGGATYSAGTNISIDTANTINCTLPITANSTNSIAVGGNSSSLGQLTCFTLGQNENKSKQNGVAAARQCSIKNMAEAAFGSAPNTVGNYTGDTYFRGRQDATLFTVGNGDTNFGGRHNALEIRQNGDLYFADTDNASYAQYYQKPMVRLQDMYGALGGLKLVSLTQSEYENLATKSSDTLYIINNVVS